MTEDLRFSSAARSFPHVVHVRQTHQGIALLDAGRSARRVLFQDLMTGPGFEGSANLLG